MVDDIEQLQAALTQAREDLTTAGRVFHRCVTPGLLRNEAAQMRDFCYEAAKGPVEVADHPCSCDSCNTGRFD